MLFLWCKNVSTDPPSSLNLFGRKYIFKKLFIPIQDKKIIKIIGKLKINFVPRPT